MSRDHKLIPLLLIIAAFLLLRLYHFQASLNYGADQGMTVLEIFNLYQTKKITLIAQTGSSLTVFGRYFYNSSLMYYLFMPILLLFKWNPVAVSYFLILLQLIVLILLYFALQKIAQKSHLALYFSIFYTFLPTMVPWLIIPVSSGRQIC